MEVLIHKIALEALQLDPHSVGVVPGDPVLLQCDADDVVSAYVSLPSRLPFGLGGRRQRCLGTLDAKPARMLLPALKRHANLRVRVVELEFPHLNRSRVNAVYISVWGKRSDLVPGRNAMARIFSRSRINDPMPGSAMSPQQGPG